MRRGFLYLVAIMDWASRMVLAWRLSNTMDAAFCVAALKDALGNSPALRFGKPAMSLPVVAGLRLDTDQGSEFTSTDFTDVLHGADVKVGMDGRGRWMGKLFIERLWRSLKYECVYLNASGTGSVLRTGLSRWIAYYNEHQPHSRFGGRTSDEVHGQFRATPAWRRNTTGRIA